MIPAIGVKIGGDSAAGEAALASIRQRAAEAAAEFGRLGPAANAAAVQVDRVAGSSGALGRGVQNAAYQVGDFAVQVAGGTSAMRAMSMQLPQLLGGFGVFGAVAGAAFAILGPLAGSFFDAADGVSKLTDEIDANKVSLDSVRGTISQLAQLHETYNKAINATGGASSSAAAIVAANAKKEYEARKQVLGVELELLRIHGGELAQGRQNLADSIKREGDAAMRNAASNPTDVLFGGLDGIVNTGARNMAEMDKALGGFIARNEQAALALRKLDAEIALNTLAVEEANAALNGDFTVSEGLDGSKGKSKGGGDSLAKKMERRLETLTNGLMTEREALDKWHSESLDAINAATDAELEALGGRNEAKLRLEEEYLQRLSQIRELGNRAALTSVLGAGEEILSALGGMNAKALRIAKVFGAAQALISTYQGAAAALKLPFPYNLSAAAAIIAKGLGFVAAIKGVNSSGGGGGAGGGGGGTSSVAPAAAGPSPLDIRISGLDPNQFYSGGAVGKLLDALTQEAGDRGFKLVYTK